MILGHKIVGTGSEKVLVLHDWFSDSSSYDQILPYMDTEEFTYVLVDLRGYGRSKEIQGRYDLEEAVEDIRELAENFEWDKFHIISHSMSSLITQKLLLSIQNSIKSIIAITPISVSNSSTSKEAFDFLEDAADKNDESALKLIHMVTGSKLTDKFTRFKVRRWRETTISMARIAYLIMLTAPNFADEITTSEIPVLAIIGRNDMEIYQEAAVRNNFMKYYPQFHLKIINDSGHFPMQETPILLASYINEFLKANSDQD